MIGLGSSLVAGFVPLDVIANLVNMGTLAAFVLISVAVLVLRKTQPDLPRAFKCPGMPYVPIAAIASCLFLMFNLKLETWIAFGIWLAIGLVLYFAFARKSSNLHPAICQRRTRCFKRRTVTHKKTRSPEGDRVF